jgi:membrane-associated phospholipid phosphatase
MTTTQYNKRYKILLLISIVFLIAVTSLFTLFLSWNEAREGYALNDPLLAILGPVNVTWMIFPLTYIPIIAAIILAARSPMLLLAAINCYTVLLLLRMLTLYLLPLDPPVGIIPLQDPVMEHTAYSGRIKLKDLFFSGHTATQFMFFLLLRRKILKIIFLLCTIMLGLLLLLQHVHYTIDVIAAPLLAWVAVWIARWINKKLGTEKVY